jgi:hypothetical protein
MAKRFFEKQNRPLCFARQIELLKRRWEFFADLMSIMI